MQRRALQAILRSDLWVPPRVTPARRSFEYLPEALDGKSEIIKSVDFPRLFEPKYVFPLRVTRHGLETFINSWSIDSKLFYMGATSFYDLIEFWNLRALGWKIRPLPADLAPKLSNYCEAYIKQNYWAYPAPSNAHHSTSFQCAKTQTIAKNAGNYPAFEPVDDHAVSMNDHFSRIWEEWGRSEDHADPQTVMSLKTSVDASIIGEGLHLTAVLPDFVKTTVLRQQLRSTRRRNPRLIFNLYQVFAVPGQLRMGSRSQSFSFKRSRNGRQTKVVCLHASTQARDTVVELCYEAATNSTP